MLYLIKIIASFTAAVWLAILVLSLRDRLTGKVAVAVEGLPEPQTSLGAALIIPLRLMHFAVVLTILASALVGFYVALLVSGIFSYLTCNPPEEAAWGDAGARGPGDGSIPGGGPGVPAASCRCATPDREPGPPGKIFGKESDTRPDR